MTLGTKIFTFLTILLISHIIPVVISHSQPDADECDSLESWVATNMKDYHDRKRLFANGVNRTNLDPELVDAEDGGITVITVKKDGTGDFKTVKEAIDRVPFDNKRRTVIWIGSGTYWEKITINCSKKFITLYGDPYDMPKIAYNATAGSFGTFYSATVAVESDYFVAVNIAFVNSAPRPNGKGSGRQAVAMRISSDKAAFHNCHFVGYQDTLCDDRGMHFYKDCYITGTIDFIFGNGKSLFLNTTINSVAKEIGVITAQARENVDDDSGFAFVYCNLTGIQNSTTYLGRAWKLRPRVVFAYTYMGTIIKAEGWSDNWQPERQMTVFYGEYKCGGPGSSSQNRVKYGRVLTDEEAKPFMSMTYIHGSSWLLPPPMPEAAQMGKHGKSPSI